MVDNELSPQDIALVEDAARRFVVSEVRPHQDLAEVAHDRHAGLGHGLFRGARAGSVARELSVRTARCGPSAPRVPHRHQTVIFRLPGRHRTPCTAAACHRRYRDVVPPGRSSPTGQRKYKPE